jgi:hypothetical protein
MAIGQQKSGSVTSPLLIFFVLCGFNFFILNDVKTATHG